MYKASYKKYILYFIRPSGTSRGILTEKETYFIFLENSTARGIGECSTIKGLSIDDQESYESTIEATCKAIGQCRTEDDIEQLIPNLDAFPSIQFGIEMALADLHNGGRQILFDSAFTRSEASIKINGLIWMSSREVMEEQADLKVNNGFDCIKIKIGALDFDKELELLERIRKKYNSWKCMIRVDANGAFDAEDCLDKLKKLAALHIHSIEQPISKGRHAEMAALCRSTPLPVALDEELIGITGLTHKRQLLETIRPQFIILKPSLMGGFRGCNEWIALAEELHIGWWITSALESNIGLNAIAQWTYTLNNPLHQGLGTGQLYLNNIPGPLLVEKGVLLHNKNTAWNFELLNEKL